MEVLTKSSDRNLTIRLEGELDHHGAKKSMRELERAVESALPLSATLDFSGVTFMDSSGIAVVLRVLRRMRELGGTLKLTKVPPQAKKVFDAAGISQMLTIE
ncbi:MAG: STAS domain-containing protein [Clostridiales bacterium]|nr:STAS domain-containing protein [Clostridiales bacterium]